MLPTELLENQSILNFFELVDIAEEEIKKFLKHNKNLKYLVDCNFLNLEPPKGMYMLNSEVYRHHCKELLRRLKTKQPLEDATLAEILQAFSTIGLQAKTGDLGRFVYAYCFQEVLGDLVLTEKYPEYLTVEKVKDYNLVSTGMTKQQVKIEIERLRKELSNPERTLKTKRRWE